MRVGIDFDNTLVNTKEVIKKYFDVYAPNSSYQSYHELPKEKEEEFIKKYGLQIVNDLQVLNGVNKAFAFFKKNHIETILVTARGKDNEKLIAATKKILVENNLTFHKMFFGVEDKGKVCAFEKIDLLIDDLEKNIDLAQKQGVKGLLFSKEKEGYTCVSNWDDIIKYIQKGLK